MTKRNCQAKVEALCHYHGVPQPALSVKDATKDMDDLTNQIVARASNMAEWHELMPLQARKTQIQKRIDYLKGKTADTAAAVSMQKEISAYKRNALKAILGEDSPEWRAYNFDPQVFLNNPEEYKRFKSSPDFDGDGPDAVATFDAHARLYEQVQGYAQTVGADGVVVVKDPDTVMGKLILPYKLHPGQFSPEEQEDILHSQKFIAAKTIVNEKVTAMEKAVAAGKPYKRSRG